MKLEEAKAFILLAKQLGVSKLAVGAGYVDFELGPEDKSEKVEAVRPDPVQDLKSNIASQIGGLVADDIELDSQFVDAVLGSVKSRVVAEKRKVGK